MSACCPGSRYEEGADTRPCIGSAAEILNRRPRHKLSPGRAVSANEPGAGSSAFAEHPAAALGAHALQIVAEQAA